MRAPRLAPELIASDVRYFELGARIETVAGARLAWMPGLVDLMAGCVVLGVESVGDRETMISALEEVERRVADLGGSRVRLYLAAPDSARTALLRQRGYTCRKEIGYIGPRATADAERVGIRPVAGEADWALKQTLHSECPDSIDGHAMSPERWVELERRKGGPGGLVPWLIEAGGRVAGCAGTIEHGPLLRLKNLLIHRDLRCQGVATAAVAAFGTLARNRGRTLGLFAVEGNPSVGVYRSCRMTPVARWMEWLGPPIERRTLGGEGA